MALRLSGTTTTFMFIPLAEFLLSPGALQAGKLIGVVPIFNPSEQGHGLVPSFRSFSLVPPPCPHLALVPCPVLLHLTGYALEKT